MARTQYVFKAASRFFCAVSTLMVMDVVCADSLMPDAPVETVPEEVSKALTFDSDFLSLGKDKKGANKEKHVDLSYFAHKGGMAPGRYAVQVKVNGKMVDEGRMVTFKSWPDQPGKLYACVSEHQLLAGWGVRASRRGGGSRPLRRMRLRSKVRTPLKLQQVTQHLRMLTIARWVVW